MVRKQGNVCWVLLACCGVILQNDGVGSRNRVRISQNEYPHLGSLPRCEIAEIYIEDDDPKMGLQELKMQNQ